MTADPDTPAAPAASPTRDPAWVRALLIGAALLLLLFFLVLPLALIFSQALAEGWAAYREQIVDPHTWKAIKLTLVTAARSSRPFSSRSASITTNTPTLSSIAGDAASPFRSGR